MFTGIIEGMGTISAVNSGKLGRRMGVEADFPLEGSKTGDSIAVNGACLTVTSLSTCRFEVDVSPETAGITTIGRLKRGDRVNLERALRLSDRLDGHLVSGHVDGIGKIRHLKSLDNALIVSISVTPNLISSMIAKGSVAVDGISLTINGLQTDSFEVSVIPHTAKVTTLGFRTAGHPVNIETDMIGKYVRRLFLNRQDNSQETKTGSGLNLEMLVKNGFL